MDSIFLRTIFDLTLKFDVASSHTVMEAEFSGSYIFCLKNRTVSRAKNLLRHQAQAFM